jgi:hypothetical protein
MVFQGHRTRGCLRATFSEQLYRMTEQKREKQKISITITRHYRPNVEFSVVSTGGLHEILRLYVEVAKMYRCVLGPQMIEALFFRTSYRLILVPTIRVYPLFPPTLNSGDTWVLKEKDAELFGISFDWPRMTAVDVRIKAEVYDHIHKENSIISSEMIRLQRNGEYLEGDREGSQRVFSFFRTQEVDSIPEVEFVPDDKPIPLSPYLYKLVTIDGFLEKVNAPDAAQLNKEAYEEIAALFHCKAADFDKLLREKSERELMFEADVHPLIAKRLIEIAPIIQCYFSAGTDMLSSPEALRLTSALLTRIHGLTAYEAAINFLTSKPTAILFLAADPTNASRLRLGEEFREIQEKLKLAKLREQFRLELPQLSLRPADISQALLDVQPKIVHFSGHGTSTGALCFENQVGETHLMHPDALAGLFEQFADHVSCVILNACYSDIQASAIAQYIDYIIGMNQAIGDKAAIAFAVGFYQALGAGLTIEEAFKLGCVQIKLQGISEHLTPILIKKSQR